MSRTSEVDDSRAQAGTGAQDDYDAFGFALLGLAQPPNDANPASMQVDTAKLRPPASDAAASVGRTQSRRPRASTGQGGREKRSRAGCFTCRHRHMKCDEAKPTCGQCSSRGIQCVWPPEQAGSGDDGEQHASALAALQAQNVTWTRKRVSRACEPCRLAKLRCSGSEEAYGGSCLRCVRNKRECTWRTGARDPPAEGMNSQGRATASPLATSVRHLDMSPEAMSSAASDKSALPDNMADSFPARSDRLKSRSEALRLLQAYFEGPHYFAFFTFIHKDRFMKLFHEGYIPHELVLVMCATAVRFAPPTPSEASSQPPPDLDEADGWADEACGLILRSLLGRYSAVDLMSILLLQKIEQARGNHHKSWLLYAGATRVMQSLGLHREDQIHRIQGFGAAPRGCPELGALLTVETLRRLGWAVFYVDTLLDAGVEGNHSISETSMRLQLPADYAAFANDERVRTEPLRSFHVPATDSRVGMLGYEIRIAALRRRLLHLASSITLDLKNDEWLPSDGSSPARELAWQDRLNALRLELRAFQQTLPPKYTVFSREPASDAPGHEIVALVLLHIRIQMCAIIAGKTQLILARHFPLLASTTARLTLDKTNSAEVHARLERVAHAFEISNIVEEALKRRPTGHDPEASLGAYVALEALIFEPMRLQSTHPAVLGDRARLERALRSLVRFLRSFQRCTQTHGELYLEACHRLVKFGYASALEGVDFSAFSEAYVPVETPEETSFADLQQARFTGAASLHSRIGRPGLPRVSLATSQTSASASAPSGSSQTDTWSSTAQQMPPPPLLSSAVPSFFGLPAASLSIASAASSSTAAPPFPATGPDQLGSTGFGANSPADFGFVGEGADFGSLEHLMMQAGGQPPSTHAILDGLLHYLQPDR